jgi:hypothetical protein
MKKNSIPLLSGAVFFLSLISMIPLAPRAQAALISPLGISIIPPVQFPPESFDVVGARVSVLWGKTREVYGLDVGALGNVTDTAFGGIAVAGGFNYNRGTATVIGLQAAGITNINVNKAHVVGVQLAGLVNNNKAESTVVGLQFSLVNASKFTTIWGLQAGLYNTARTVNGFQIGLINRTESLHGIQIGLANFNHTGLFEFAPILNIGF